MSDEIIVALAAKAGISPTWTDQTGAEQHVSIGTLRAVLDALALPCANDAEARNSLSALEAGMGLSHAPQFLTARAGQPVLLPLAHGEAHNVEILLENGSIQAATAEPGVNGAPTLPPFEDPGYHTVRTGQMEITIAAAPHRCVTIKDRTDGAGGWSLAAQIYSLRRQGDSGIGDFGGVAALAAEAGRRGADALAISPVHAPFAANPHAYSPYSPSSRLFYNPLYARLTDALPEEWVADAIEAGGHRDEISRLETLELVDWPAATRIKHALMRSLHEKIQATPGTVLPAVADFQQFLATASPLLTSHATFEAIHAEEFGRDPNAFHWRNWREPFRNPESADVRTYAGEHASEISFHIFLQWLAGKSYASAQRACRDSGMRIGLIADLAIGMESAGSHAWSRQQDVLPGLNIGAPPDFYTTQGQDWGLTTFSPRGLHAESYAPFIDTLRAVLRYAGGVRIDHVMGLSRLWLIPAGARPTEGCYVNFPSETLFRLAALESWRHKTVMIGEDLGTLPHGFREYLQQQGVAGLRVLKFERDAAGFYATSAWTPDAAALTMTHDTISTGGWWKGADLSAPDDPSRDVDSPYALRAWDRGLLWSAFEREGIVQGERPAPENYEPVVDAAVRFIAKTSSALKMLALEDAIGSLDQPNVPGTTTERPNWRIRLPGDSADLLNGEGATRRLDILAQANPRRDLKS